MENLVGHLEEGRPERQSKFLNSKLSVGKEFIGIYKAARKTENSYGRTIHYILDGIFEGEDREWVLDSKNIKVAEIFYSIKFDSRVSIKKVSRDGRIYYDVRLLNNIEDEICSL